MQRPDATALLTIARTWLGTPFAHLGRTKGVGVDCVGLVIETCREAGLVALHGLPPDWNHTAYSRFPQSYHLLHTLEALLPHVPVMDMRAGDIVVFQTLAHEPAHLGFVADGAHPYSLVHAFNAPTRSRAKVLEHRFSPAWVQKVHSVFRLPLEA